MVPSNLTMVLYLAFMVCSTGLVTSSLQLCSSFTMKNSRLHVGCVSSLVVLWAVRLGGFL